MRMQRVRKILNFNDFFTFTPIGFRKKIVLKYLETKLKLLLLSDDVKMVELYKYSLRPPHTHTHLN